MTSCQERVSNPLHLIRKPDTCTSSIVETDAKAGAGELAQQLRAVAALAEAQAPSWHLTVTHNCL